MKVMNKGKRSFQLDKEGKKVLLPGEIAKIENKAAEKLCESYPGELVSAKQLMDEASDLLDDKPNAKKKDDKPKTGK